MQIIQLYSDIEITVKEHKKSVLSLHRHHFFELMYVLEGAGSHIINGNSYTFSKGHAFLLTPEDSHAFEIITPVRFCIIDFTKNFFSKNTDGQNARMNISDFFKRLEYIFHNHHNIEGNIVPTSERNIFKVLINKLIKENENHSSYTGIISQNIVFLLLNLIARNIQLNFIDDFSEYNASDKILEITDYIRQNIYDKELIKIENLAIHFHKSTDHLSRYFKNQTGGTIKDYITRYKFNLIQTRLKFSDFTISEISHEMGFTDVSHLNKSFKKMFGKTATQFRNDEKQKL